MCTGRGCMSAGGLRMQDISCKSIYDVCGFILANKHALAILSQWEGGTGMLCFAS
jgi:hypothetical protein